MKSGPGLVTDSMRRYLVRLDQIEDLLDHLRDHPAAMLRKWLDDWKRTPDSPKTRIGRRNFLWAVWALDSLLSHPMLREEATKTIGASDELRRQFAEDLIAYTSHHYAPETLTADIDPFWKLSLAQAALHLRAVVARVSPGSAGNLEPLLDAWVNASPDVAVELQETFEQPLGWYMRCWAVQGKDWDDRSAQVRLIESQSDRVHRDLEAQLAYRLSRSARFSPLELAAAASTLWRTCREGFEDENVARQLEAAAQVCLSPPIENSYLPKRLIRRTKDYGQIHNLPWEEVLLALALPVRYLPSDFTVSDPICEYIRKRITRSAYGSAGVAEESHEGFPASADYFTNYCIVLLSHLRVALRGVLRRAFVQRVNGVGAHYVLPAKAPDTDRMTLDQLAESVEGTRDYLLGRLPGSQAEFDTDPTSFNTVLIFGPPGTGKTTIVEAFVNHFNDLGITSAAVDNPEDREWVGITLAPGMFLTDDSFASILDHAQEVFSVARRLDHCVLFFDEVEELARGRDGTEDRFSRMFTAAMLLHLNDLKAGNVVHVMATNHIRRMDPAAIRKGRFAVRKGLGWVHDDAVPSLVTNLFGEVEAEATDYLVRRLRHRPIAEIIALRKAWKQAGSPSSESELAELLDRWKPYLSEDVRNAHLSDLRDFDDSFDSE